VLFLGRRGYLKASLGEPEIEVDFTGLRIVVPVHEGAPYRWGVLTVKGSTVFSSGEVTKIVGMRSGEIADGYGMQGGLDELEKLYRNRGFLQFSVAFIPEFRENVPNADEGLVDLSLELEEGGIYRIDSISFDGNSKTPDQILRRPLRIHEGDIYNESLLESSLELLNALGLFEKLTRADVRFQSNDETKLTAITIRLREKIPQ